MEHSRIEWTDHTFNPWRGCTKVSPGCEHCYAETLSRRNPAVLGTWGRGRPRVRAIEATWRQPLRWNGQAAQFLRCHACGWRGLRDASAVCPTPGCLTFFSEMASVRQRVFCASLADWLDDEVLIEWFVDLLSLIYRTPNLDWQLLTKRPQNWAPRLAAAIESHYRRPKLWTKDHVWFRQWMIDWSNVHKGPPHPLVQPPANVWVGTTVEDQTRADERVPILLSIPATVRFLSCEPLLGPVDLTEINGALSSWGRVSACDAVWPGGLHLVICGGESGNEARPMHPDWARLLLDQCAGADLPFFFKQWGEWKPHSGWDVWKRAPATTWVNRRTGATWQGDRADAVVGDSETAEDASEWALMVHAGKKLSGRLLDGREWNGMPASERELAR